MDGQMRPLPVDMAPDDFAPLISIKVDERTGNLFVKGKAGEYEMAFACLHGTSSDDLFSGLVAAHQDLRNLLWERVRPEATKHAVVGAIEAMAAKR